MIRRSNTNSANNSLVNTANNDHYNVTKGIRTDVPVTDNTSVVKSINFEAEHDGSYVLRKPLILKEVREDNTEYLFDYQHKIYYDGTNAYIKNNDGSHEISFKLVYYNNTVKRKEFSISSDKILNNVITQILSFTNTADHSLVSVIIDHTQFNQLTEDLLVYRDSNYGNLLYRFLKIYKEIQSDLTYKWIVEIVHPEFNSITSAIDTTNASTLDINLLLDNPYAIRDLYGYGINSTTKIVPYVTYNMTIDDINNSTICQLTESLTSPISLDEYTDIQGFKLLVSTTTGALQSSQYLILKAFVTTAVTSSRYLCCWERSTNGVDWEVCPEFLDKFKDTDNAPIDVLVSDVTSAEFEKIAYQESLTKAANYLVNKKMVRFNYKDNKDLSENDIILNRPDVLIVNNLDTSIQYRFQIYTDSGKSAPVNENNTISISKSFFNELTGGYVDTDETIQLDAYTGSGYDTDPDSSTYEETLSPSIESGILVLNEGTPNEVLTDALAGNAVTFKIDSAKSDYKISKVAITLANKGITNVNRVEKIEATNAPIFYQISDDEINNMFGPQVFATDTNGNRSRIDTDTEHCVIQYILYNTIASPGTRSIFNPEETFNSLTALKDFLNEKKLILQDIYGESTNGAIRTEYARVKITYTYETGKKVTTSYSFGIWYYFGPDNKDIFAQNYLNNEADTIVATGYNTNKAETTELHTKTAIGYNTNVISSYDNIKCSSFTDTKLIDASTRVTLFETDTYEDSVSQFNIWNISSGDSTLHSDPYKYKTYIQKVEITYRDNAVKTTSIYLTSTTGNFQIPFSENTVVVEDLTSRHQQLFKNKVIKLNEQFMFYGLTNEVYISDLGSSIVKLMNTLNFGTEVVKIVPWRSYYLAFTEKDITLLKYDDMSGTFNLRIISNSIGLPKEDADTAISIMNSVYFKSKYKVYKIVPNLYASADEILNLHVVSEAIEDVIEHLISPVVQSHNFVYTDSEHYYLFIPTDSNNTYCFVYNYADKVWCLHDYPIVALQIDNFSLKEEYIKTEKGWYYFKEDLDVLLKDIIIYDNLNIGGITDDGTYSVLNIGVQLTRPDSTTYAASIVMPASNYNSLIELYDYVPYMDLLEVNLPDLYGYIKNNDEINFDDATNELYGIGESSRIQFTPIQFEIDFGQKSSNYTLDKQFLESKFIFATLQPQDNFRISLDILTDGMQLPLHWDANTDSSLWKTSLNQKGTVNTTFYADNSHYNGILKQLFVKYSGKGKTIQHYLTGTSKSKFKFYSMDTRYRVLPKKQ